MNTENDINTDDIINMDTTNDMNNDMNNNTLNNQLTVP